MKKLSLVLLAKAVADARKAQNITQADLAKATGKKTPVVTKWMSGMHNFTMRTIAEIEVALGEEIITVKQYKPKSTRPAPKPYQMTRPASLYVNEERIPYNKEPDKE